MWEEFFIGFFTLDGGYSFLRLLSSSILLAIFWIKIIHPYIDSLDVENVQGISPYVQRTKEEKSTRGQV